jgi:hypothetical protein
MRASNRAVFPLLAGVAAILTLGVLSTRPARAEHFDIGMICRTSKGLAECGWDTYPPEGGINKRQVVSAVVGEDISLEWRMRSEFPHGVMRNVVCRLFVAKEDEIGQKKEPDHDGPTVLNNTLTADFLSHHTARGQLHFRVAEPGNYLIRIESELTLKEHGHEHFGAIDLKVENE